MQVRVMEVAEQHPVVDIGASGRVIVGDPFVCMVCLAE